MLVFAFDFLSVHVRVPVCVCVSFVSSDLCLSGRWVGCLSLDLELRLMARVSSEGQVSWQHVRLRSAAAVPGVALLS